jgi:hypothetical protein
MGKHLVLAATRKPSTLIYISKTKSSRQLPGNGRLAMTERLDEFQFQNFHLISPDVWLVGKVYVVGWGCVTTQYFSLITIFGLSQEAQY